MSLLALALPAAATNMMFCGVGAGDGIFQALRVAPAAPGVVGGHHVEALARLQLGEVVHRLDRRWRWCRQRAEELGREQPHVPVDPGDAEAVVPLAPMVPATWVPWASRRAVVDGLVVIGEVPAAHVVDVAVDVVVDAIGLDGRRALSPGFLPALAVEVGMVILVALVDDPDVHRVARRSSRPPTPRPPDFRTALAGRRGVAVHAPQRAVGVFRVVRLRIVGVDPVRLGEGHVGVRLEAAGGLGPVDPVHFHQLDGGAVAALVRHLADPFGPGPAAGLRPAALGHPVPVPDEQLAGDGGGLRRRGAASGGAATPTPAGDNPVARRMTTPATRGRTGSSLRQAAVTEARPLATALSCLSAGIRRA